MPWTVHGMNDGMNDQYKGPSGIYHYCGMNQTHSYFNSVVYHGLRME